MFFFATKYNYNSFLGWQKLLEIEDINKFKSTGFLLYTEGILVQILYNI
jgi:hypothetical protein